MASVSIRYIVDDVDAAIAFYCGHLGFTELMHPAPQFAMLKTRRSATRAERTGWWPGRWAGDAGRHSAHARRLEPLLDRGRGPGPNGAKRSEPGGAHFRNEIVTGVGGKQTLVDDPSGNPIELFEPTRDEARLVSGKPDSPISPISPVSRMTDFSCIRSGGSSPRWSTSPTRRIRAVWAPRRPGW